MKRYGNIYPLICSRENLQLAADRAMKGKHWQPGVIEFKANREAYITALQKMLINKTYRTSPYTTFPVYEPKERIVFRLPFFPDRIMHHAIMIPMEKIFVSTFTADTYSCIKKKGIHAALRNVKKALQNEEGTKYCLKLDIKKFYPSISHEILKKLIRRKLKDHNLLWLMDGIINSTSGLPIGNFLSQPLANFFLTYFDHWIKEKMAVKNYFRYADDMAIFSGSKEYLHKLLFDIRKYLWEELHIEIKGNYQIFPVESRGLNFLGYIFRHRYILIHPTIKRNFIRKLNRMNRASQASYRGWFKHCDAKHLQKKYLNETVQ